MNQNLAELHATLEKIAALDEDGLTKQSLAELPELPIQDWATLQKDLRSNTYEVREMAVYPADFGVFAGPGEKLRFDLMKYLALAVPIAVLGLAIFVTGWSLLLIPLAVLPLQFAKRLYRRVLAESATASEKVFAFLFSRNMIFLYREGKSFYRDNREQSS